MAKFVDGAGREWLVAVDVAAVRRMRAATGFDLWKVSAEGMAPIGELMADVVRLVDTLHAAVRPEATARNVTADQFCEGLAGDALGAAAEAFVTACVDFFPPALRDQLRRIQAVGRAAEAAAARAMEAKIAAAEADPTTLSGPPTGSPGPSDSTPAP